MMNNDLFNKCVNYYKAIENLKSPQEKQALKLTFVLSFLNENL